MNKNLTSAIIIGFFVGLAFASPQRFSAVLLLSIVVGVMSFFKWLLTRTSIECMRVIKQPILPNNNKKVDKVNKVSKTFRIFVAVNKQNRKVFMITTATRKTAPDTFTLTVPKADVSFFKTMAKKMGWTVERKKAAKPRLYDPETGDYLNDATMKVIEDARKGKNVIEVGSMDDYLKLVNNL